MQIGAQLYTLRIRLGIIGIGNMGSNHAKEIVGGKCPDFELVAIADVNEERHNWARETLGENIQLFFDADKMINSGMIDACLIAVPHYDHPRYAIACMQKGIHVLA